MFSRTAILLAAVGVLAAACQGDTGNVVSPASGPLDANEVHLTAQDGDSIDIFRGEVTNKWGTTSVESYISISQRSTTDHPYGPLAGGFTVAIPPLVDLLGQNQAIVVGNVINISPPYYNSADGGFWYEPRSEAGRSILQDVTIRVERIFGDIADITTQNGSTNELITVTIGGGQIEFTFNESIDPALLPEGFEQGQTYTESIAPFVNVTEGDRVLVILRRDLGPWFGAPLNPDMPWSASTSITGNSLTPVGTNTLIFGSWQTLGQGSYLAVFPDRTVTFDELSALVTAHLGQLLSDGSAPIGPGNMPQRPPAPN